VGNSTEGSFSVIPAAGRAGRVTCGRVMAGGNSGSETIPGTVTPLIARVFGIDDGATPPATSTVAEARAGAAPVALASPISSTCSPRAAWPPTVTLARRLSARSAGRFPRLQVAPLADGQELNLGELRCAAGRSLMLTVVSLLVAWVVQTVIE
jgi:hypothetical protein